MLVSKICLTGGPCAGKTTALSKIDNELTNMGYKVFIIDEVATRIINEGIRPFGEGKISMLDFERILLKEQLINEECFSYAANLIDKKCVIICDRGVFDVKSFLNEKDFDSLIKEFGKTKLELMDSYDLVISLTTAAKGAQKYYTTSNNSARKEDIKEAIISDDKVQDAWSFHNNLKIVSNKYSFDEKMNNVLEIIKKHLNIDEKKEAKYVVELPINIDNIKDYTKIRITQTYLKTNGNYEMRLRKRSLEGENSYYVTIKKIYDDKEKIITEEKIDERTYNILKNQREIVNELDKTRVCFSFNDNMYKLDMFDNGMNILEASAISKVPEFIKVIKDVTNDKNYKNINIESGKSYVYKNK